VRRLVNETVDRPKHTAAEFFPAIQPPGIVYTADNIETACELAVVIGTGGENLHIGQINELYGYGGRTNINGNPVVPAGPISCLNSRNPAPSAFARKMFREGHLPGWSFRNNRDGYVTVCGPQGINILTDDRERKYDLFFAKPLL
jgi:hypothetical protein